MRKTTNMKTDHRCAGVTKKGKPCRAAAIQGGVLCLFHAKPELAVQLGKKGGRGNRHIYRTDEPPPLENVIAVRDYMARILRDLMAGKIDRRFISGLAPLMNLQLRIIERTDVDERLTAIEKHLEQLPRDR